METSLPVPDLAPVVSPKSSPGIAQSLALCAYFLVLMVIMTCAVFAYKFITRAPVDEFLAMFFQQLIAWPTTLWLGLRWSGVSFRQACPLTAFPGRIIPALVITSFGLAILLSTVGNLIPMPEMIRQSMTEAFRNSSTTGLLLAIVLAAPLAEELFFRGLMLRGFLGRYSVTKAVWASAILFALIHLNPWQAVAALPIGLLCAWLYLRTGSLWPAIITHAVTNFTAVFLMYELGFLLGYDEVTLRAMRQVPPEMILIGAIAATVGGITLWRQMRPSLAAI